MKFLCMCTVCTMFSSLKYLFFLVNKLNLNANFRDVKTKFEEIDVNKDGKLSTKVTKSFENFPIFETLLIYST